MSFGFDSDGPGRRYGRESRRSQGRRILKQSRARRPAPLSINPIQRFRACVSRRHLSLAAFHDGEKDSIRLGLLSMSSLRLLEVREQELGYAVGHLIDDKVASAFDFYELVWTVSEFAR